MSGSRDELRFDARAAGGIAYLTIDNQAKLNTLDRALMSEFIAAVERLAPRKHPLGLIGLERASTIPTPR
jgi:enoyl-CoA hydratase/carnithine racemase